MPKFLRKPMVVEAEQWFFNKEIAGVEKLGPTDNFPQGLGRIKTKAGMMVVRPGEWILTGPDGEIYPVSQANFEQLYVPFPAGTESEGLL